MEYQIFYYIGALVLILPGIFFTLIPMFPALAYMFGIALIYAFVGGFTVLSVPNLAVLFSLVVISFLIDHLAGLLGAKYSGAHAKSMLWGILAGLIGTFFFPPFGSLIGICLGVLFAELYYMKTTHQAIKSASGALMGAVAGIAVNMFLAIVFLIVFAFLALN